MKAQGATEYLVLLAVVLIVALVSVALLGFFPGMASETRVTESQAYWQGAQPIAIVESHAVLSVNWGSLTFMNIRVRNGGAYPVRITKLLGSESIYLSQFAGDGDNCGVLSTGIYNISDYFYLAPGEEKYFNPGYGVFTGCSRTVAIGTGGSSGYTLGGAASLCANSNSSPGYVEFKKFGFEYILPF